MDAIENLPRYYWADRPELQALVPLTAKRVLDVGCGAGGLGNALKSRGIEVTGIEYDRKMAHHAEQFLHQVIAGDVEIMMEALQLNYYDCIILGDVLEHLRDPEGVLKRLKKSLREDGVIVASLPNVNHWSIIRGLLEGRWQYENAGILDRTHLRFFTRRSIVDLFNEAGYRVDQIEPIIPQCEKIPEGVITSLQANGIASDNLREESAAYQYLIKAKPRREALTSIVILTYNELEYTKKCVESIQKYTAEPYELIFVDNGSTDGTIEYLQSLSGTRVIANPINMGFGAGCNQGIAQAGGEYIVLLNNDTVVTEGWLTRMIIRAESDPSVGMVGPMSNYVVGPQLIMPVPYGDDLLKMHEFASNISVANKGVSFQVFRLVGFCILLKRSVVEKIGGFDESFGRGNFEDDDLCIRANLAGFKLLVCKDVLIHHFGSRTFSGAKIDYRKMMNRNWMKFKEKWGLPVNQPIENGYRFDQIANKLFYPPLHYSPLEKNKDGLGEVDNPNINSKKSFKFLTVLDWPEIPAKFWQALEAYLNAFKADEDVSLVILSGEEEELDLKEIGNRLEKAINGYGFEINNIPDIELTKFPEISRERLTLYRSIQAYIPTGELFEETHRKELRACGCRQVEEPVSYQLREIAELPLLKKVSV